ncbi:MAG: aspartate kinase [Candidatus Jordarchaeaceae archaeon]
MKFGNKIVMKFGGSCLKDLESFHRISKILKEYSQDGLVLVASALYGVTNNLINLAKNAEKHSADLDKELSSIAEKHVSLAESVIKSGLKEVASEEIQKEIMELKTALRDIWDYGLKPQRLDLVSSFGERFSTIILHRYLQSVGYKTVYVSSYDIIFTTSEPQNALPLLDITEQKVKEKLVPLLNENKIPVVTGFFGRDEKGNITLLGRGGSDFTATIIAYCLKNENNSDVKVILWKDVDGLLTANPKLEPRAHLIRDISYSEAKELAFFGAKLLHPLCIFPVERKEIPVEIRNFDSPNPYRYTRISKGVKTKESVVKAIADMRNVNMITVEGEAMVSRPGTAAKLFELMGKNNVNIIMISQSSSENNITFIVSDEDKQKAIKALNWSPFFGKDWVNVEMEDDVSLISVVGAGMKNTCGVAGRIFSALGKAKVNIRAIAQGSSELNISLVVSREDLEKAVKAIHEEFKLHEDEEEN